MSRGKRTPQAPLTWLVGVALLALPASALALSSADRLDRSPEVALGPLVDAPDGRSPMELVAFDDSLVASLLAAAPEETVRVDGWPVAPGVRAPALLRRFDVYAPDAKVVVVENGVAREVPRSRLVFFRGATAGGPAAGPSLAVWVDPETLEVGGLVLGGQETFALEPSIGSRGRLSRLAAATAFRPDGIRPVWSCGVHEEELAALVGRRERATSVPSPTAPADLAIGPLATLTRSAVVAFDTDSEYLNLRFANNTASATSYIAQLVAGMSVIYERDVGTGQGNGVKVLQGYTILRVGSDPYSNTIGSADSTKLNEFTNYWEAQYPRTVVRRALAALLSGKQGSSNSASGIGWVGALCGGSGYSVDQLFTGAFGLSYDLEILAHEVGHNFGAYHTHSCYYSPPIDTCLAAEGGCAPQGSCPALQTINGVTNVEGTLMSYCHLRGDGCTSSLVFHPRSITDNPSDPYGVDSVLTEVANATCLTTLAGGAVPPAPTISTVSPSTGSTGGGTSVTITGTNFVSGATVAFVELPSNDVFGTPSSKSAASVTFNSSTQLTVSTPSATNAGAVDVVVMNPDLQTATKPSGFTYGSGPTPLTLTGGSPRTGLSAGGTGITLTGTGFVAGATVTVGGAAATSVVVPNSTTITAVTPARPIGPADVVVTIPGPKSATLPGGFLYTATGSPTRIYTLPPCRLVDTRNATGAFGGPALSAGQLRSFTVPSGSCGIPADVVALSMNVTVADATAAGTLTFFPGSGAIPATNTITFVVGKNRANNVTMGTVGGVLSVRNYQTSGTVNLIIDVNGYYR